MKPPHFEYHAPETVEEALNLLAEHPSEAKVLAGGQSLVPLLNFRLTRPGHVIDINGVAGLAGVRRRDGRLWIGATTRHAALERSSIVGERWPLLRAAVAQVAHAQIRNRGTVGGSMAHADAKAELPVAMLALDASLHVRSVRGVRSIPVSEFFITHMTTALEPDELLVEIEIPPQPAGTGTGFHEYARRHGDYAIGGAAALVTVDHDMRCQRAAIALLGAADVPLRAAGAEALLQGRRLDQSLAAEASALAVADTTPTGDQHGGSEYRRAVIQAMVRRALVQAYAAAQGRG